MEPAPWDDGPALWADLLAANELLARARRFVFNDNPNEPHSGNRTVNQFYVEHRGGRYSDEHDTWAIVTTFECLSRRGEWVHERIPSERSDEWRTEHRFTFAEAIAIATRAEELLGVGRRLVNLDPVSYADVNAKFRTAVAEVLVGIF